MSGQQDNLLAAAAQIGKSWALAWMNLSSGRFLTRLLASQAEAEFPPHQKPGSFNLERVMESITKGAGDK